MGEKESKLAATEFAYSAARHLAELLLPVGFGLGEFLAAAKSAFVETAAEHIRRGGNRVSTSRIAVVTGLSRAEVSRIRAQNEPRKPRNSEQRAERVMHGWFTDPRFLDAAGAPIPLPHTGRISLTELIRKYSGDVPRQAVLKELLKGGMVELLDDGLVGPLRRHYATSTSEIVEFSTLCADLDVLFRSAVLSKQHHESAVRRISVQFDRPIPTGVRRNITIRTDRFFDALSEYLHSSSVAVKEIEPQARTRHSFHMVIATNEHTEPVKLDRAKPESSKP